MKKLFLLTILISLSGAHAQGAYSPHSTGLSLLEASGARAAALGEAFTSVPNDIEAFQYNPASLNSLNTGQASLMFHQGTADDVFNQFTVGAPTRRGKLGLSAGYYNGGSMELFDGVNSRTVNVQTDLLVALGYANGAGRFSYGMTAKYLSSELAETVKARAYAADLGIGWVMRLGMRIGASLQNFGTTMRYVNYKGELPQTARAGMSIDLNQGRYSSLVLLDAAYLVNEHELRPAIGLEMSMGVLALRSGYQGGYGTGKFSVGAGFVFGKTSLDYAFGMVQDLDTRHRVSLSLKFGGFAPAPEKKPTEEKDNRQILHWNDEAK